MGTVTAWLWKGSAHPYDGGLWGIPAENEQWALVEGSRCSWVSVQEKVPPHLALPRRILQAGLALCAGNRWEGIPSEEDSAFPSEKLEGAMLILAIFPGSSLRAANCRALLRPWKGIVLDDSTEDTTPPTERGLASVRFP